MTRPRVDAKRLTKSQRLTAGQDVTAAFDATSRDSAEVVEGRSHARAVLAKRPVGARGDSLALSHAGWPCSHGEGTEPQARASERSFVALLRGLGGISERRFAVFSYKEGQGAKFDAFVRILPAVTSVSARRFAEFFDKKGNAL